MNKVMYVAQRFHTNQGPAVKSLIKNNVEVIFISQYRHKTENNETLYPTVLGYSWISNLFFKLVYFFYKSDSKYMERKYGIPPIVKAFNIVYRSKPDIVILRERTLYSLMFIFICKLLSVDYTIYIQTPLEIKNKENIKLFIKRVLFGKYEYSPILAIGGEIQQDRFIRRDYVPLVIEPDNSEKRKTIKKVRFLVVSEYIPRKNIIKILEIFSEIKKSNSDFELMIIGNNDKIETKKYFKDCFDFAEKNNLLDKVTFKTNLKYDEVKSYYQKMDVFLLFSERESACFSLLEAMSCGMFIVCAGGAGLDRYLSDKGSLIFKERDFKSAKKDIVSIIENPNLILNGRYNKQKVESHYSLNDYYNKLLEHVTRVKEKS